MRLKTKETRFWLAQVLVIGVSTMAAAQISASSVLPLGDASWLSSNTSVTTDHSKPAILPVETATDSLPDAPSAVAAQEAQQVQAAPMVEQPVAQRPKAPANTPTADSTFLIANSFLWGSTIANAEMIARCRPSACQAVPDGIRQRGDLYGIGIPASLAVSYISYRLKKSGTGMWILPVALFTVGNVVYATHAAQYTTQTGGAVPPALHKR